MIKEKIYLVIQESERPLSITDIKKELQFKAVKEAYGVSSFTIGDVRKIVQELILDEKISQQEIEKKFPVYKTKEENGDL